VGEKERREAWAAPGGGEEKDEREWGVGACGQWRIRRWGEAVEQLNFSALLTELGSCCCYLNTICC
jgi:hypothetical protein